MKIQATLAAAGLVISAHAAPTILWMRQESNSAIPQTVEPKAGTNSLTLPFSGTTTYDFFSPPLTSSVSLTTADKGAGIIYMRNTAAVGAYDFAVKGRMQYFDYDPVARTNILIVDTGLSAQKSINHGQTVNWPMPNENLPAAKTLSAGHLLHVSVTVTLTVGFPGAFGFLVYNGPTGTQGQLPEEKAISYPFGPLLPKSRPSLACSVLPDRSVNITFSGSPGATYTVEAATNPSDPVWVSLGVTNANTNGLVIFKDTGAPRYPSRFYRTTQ